MKTYSLTKTAKGSKYLYQVIDDETGQVVSKRSSTRDYIACTANGAFYFGRLDLIGKGEHGRYIKSAMKAKHYTREDYMADREDVNKKYNRWYASAKHYGNKTAEELADYKTKLRNDLDKEYPLDEASIQAEIEEKNSRGQEQLEWLNAIAYLK